MQAPAYAEEGGRDKSHRQVHSGKSSNQSPVLCSQALVQDAAGQLTGFPSPHTSHWLPRRNPRRQAPLTSQVSGGIRTGTASPWPGRSPARAGPAAVGAGSIATSPSSGPGSPEPLPHSGTGPGTPAASAAASQSWPHIKAQENSPGRKRFPRIGAPAIKAPKAKNALPSPAFTRTQSILIRLRSELQKSTTAELTAPLYKNTHSKQRTSLPI